MPETTTTEPTQALNGREAPPRTARVVGLGHKLPDRVVPNGPIAERIGVDADWIVRRTGIRSRRYAAPDERTSDLAVAAARRALHDAGARRFIEVGPGKVLAGLARRIVKGTKTETPSEAAVHA